MAGAGSREDPVVLSDDEDEPPPPPVISVIRVPASDLSIGLTIKESTVIPGQPGLFATSAIPANSFIALYRYSRVMTDAQLSALPAAPRDAISRYAVAGPRPHLTLVIDPPITDRANRLAAMANEPSSSQAANMALHTEEVALDTGTFYVVALYSCDAPIPAGAELTWFCAWVGLDLCDRALPLVPYVSLVCLRRRPIVRPS